MIAQRVHADVMKETSNKDIHNYKGYFFNNEETDSHSYEGGAHFKYKDLYKRLEKIAREAKFTEERDSECIINNFYNKAHHDKDKHNLNNNVINGTKFMNNNNDRMLKLLETQNKSNFFSDINKTSSLKHNSMKNAVVNKDLSISKLNYDPIKESLGSVNRNNHQNTISNGLYLKTQNHGMEMSPSNFSKYNKKIPQYSNSSNTFNASKYPLSKFNESTRDQLQINSERSINDSNLRKVNNLNVHSEMKTISTKIKIDLPRLNNSSLYSPDIKRNILFHHSNNNMQLDINGSKENEIDEYKSRNILFSTKNDQNTKYNGQFLQSMQTSKNKYGHENQFINKNSVDNNLRMKSESVEKNFYTKNNWKASNSNNGKYI